MGNKISYALNKCKMVLIMILVLWVILSIVLIMPGTIAVVESTVGGKVDSENMISTFFDNVGSVGTNIGKIFKAEYIGAFFKGELYLILALLFFGVIGIIKTLPKHDYADIEHGSSDWATGEKYMILNRNKGILLAEKHYLPVDKRGNTNVLVVGRFRFW